MVTGKIVGFVHSNAHDPDVVVAECDNGDLIHFYSSRHLNGVMASSKNYIQKQRNENVDLRDQLNRKDEVIKRYGLTVEKLTVNYNNLQREFDEYKNTHKARTKKK